MPIPRFYLATLEEVWQSVNDGLEALLVSRGATSREKLDTVAAKSGSLDDRFLPSKKRPTHRTGMFDFFGAKADSIDWCRDRLKTLIRDTDAARAKYHGGGYKKVNAAFIEFLTQSAAQGAYQTLSHYQGLHMSPRYIGMHPNEIVWGSLGISWWQKVVRRYTVQAFITALIIFWTILVAGVGLISNIPQLAKISCFWSSTICPLVHHHPRPSQDLRRAHFSARRAIHSECILFLPGRTGLLGCNTWFGRVVRR
ncbi:hypothetical protein VE03_10223 [Pseudogymnoascus sp. 23342-1-I1]|nr:hypothetical protein VE03_10223 [Pseudogymnoascus sp. 23342-1-I1]